MDRRRNFFASESNVTTVHLSKFSNTLVSAIHTTKNWQFLLAPYQFGCAPNKFFKTSFCPCLLYYEKKVQG